MGPSSSSSSSAAAGRPKDRSLEHGFRANGALDSEAVEEVTEYTVAWELRSGGGLCSVLGHHFPCIVRAQVLGFAASKESELQKGMLAALNKALQERGYQQGTFLGERVVHGPQGQLQSVDLLFKVGDRYLVVEVDGIHTHFLLATGDMVERLTALGVTEVPQVLPSKPAPRKAAAAGAAARAQSAAGAEGAAGAAAVAQLQPSSIVFYSAGNTLLRNRMTRTGGSLLLCLGYWQLYEAGPGSSSNSINSSACAQLVMQWLEQQGVQLAPAPAPAARP